MTPAPTTMHRLVLALFLAILTGLASPRPVVAQSPEIRLTASAGYDGYYQSEAWLPVAVVATNDGPDLVGRLRLTASGGGAEAVRYEAPLELPSRSAKRVQSFVFPTRGLDRIEVVLLEEGGRIAATAESNVLRPLDPNGILYGVISPEPDEFAFLDGVTGGRPEAAVAYLALDDLPAATAAWDALDVLILNGIDTGSLDPAALDALDGFVQSGGLLVVTAGAGWQGTIAAVADWLPVAIDGVVTLPDLPALSAAAALPFRDPGPYVVADAALREGRVLLHQDGLPLFAVAERGAGAVFFLGLDPRLAPLKDWDGGETLWAEIAARVPARPYWAGGVRDVYAAAAAAEALPDVSLPSATMLLLFLALYVVTIGPVNYLVLKRRDRLELAWLTIPGLIVLFTVLAYLFGFGLKGNTVILNQMAVVSGEAGGQFGRLQSIVGIYSPRRDRYALRLPRETLARPFSRGGGGIAGDGGAGVVESGPETIVRDILVDVSGVGALLADGRARLPALEARAELALDAPAGGLNVSLRNSGGQTLESAALIVGNSAMAIGDLAPGDTWSGTPALGPSTTGGTSGAAPGPIAASGAVSPLANHYSTLLGSPDYTSDRVLYGRWQLLVALEDHSGGSSYSAPVGTVTLVAWTTEPQLALALDEAEPRQVATTLYLLDVPVAASGSAAVETAVPQALWGWRVLGSSGLFEISPTNLELYDGWVEFEFAPWPVFQTMRPTSLGINLLPESTGAGALPPDVRLWDWSQEIWVSHRVTAWGVTEVPAFTPYVGPRNAVRLRLASSGVPVSLRAAFPVLEGTTTGPP